VVGLSPTSHDTSGYDREHVAEFYDFIVPYRERRDVQFFVDEAKACAGEVLEIGCGTGRVLLPTARAGVRITGLDASAAMLEECRRSVAKEPDEVRARISLHTGDMRSFNLGRRFDLVTLPFRPFQHLVDVPEQTGCLRCIHSHLNAGGKLVLDVFNPSLDYLTCSLEETLGTEPEFTMPDGRRVLRTRRALSRDIARQVNEVELAYRVTKTNGEVEHFAHVFPMRYYFRYEIEHLLARCGFELQDVYSDYDRTPFGGKYPGEILCIARRI
jgi:SAM-dependent methyltransferase